METNDEIMTDNKVNASFTFSVHYDEKVESCFDYRYINELKAGEEGYNLWSGSISNESIKQSNHISLI